MRVVAFETTEHDGSVAIVDDDGLSHERTFTSGRGHGPALYLELEALLVDVNLTLPMIDVFAAGAGPGSFTGVRVGLAAAKALAFALGKRATAISSLEVLAGSDPADGFLCPILDARKNEVYAAVYRRDGGELVEVAPAWVGPASAAAERALAISPDIRFLGSGVTTGLLKGSPTRLSARVLAEIVLRRHLAGGPLLPASARYVRPAEAEVKFGLAKHLDPLAHLAE